MIRQQLLAAFPARLYYDIMSGKVRTREGKDYRQEVTKVPNPKKKDAVKWNRAKYRTLFRKYSDKPNPYRIYLELDGTVEDDVIPPKSVVKELNSQGFVIDNYVAGYAIKKDNPASNPIRIGKILDKATDKSILQQFVNDPQRGARGDYLVVISRHPYDIMGASTDKGWSSCFQIGSLSNGSGKLNDEAESKENWGANWEFTLADIEQGGLIAYLIDKRKQTVPNTKQEGAKKRRLNATARVSIRPFTSPDGKDTILWHSGVVYGANHPAFLRTLEKWLMTSQKIKHKLYNISTKVYHEAKGLYGKVDLSEIESLKGDTLGTAVINLIEQLGEISAYNALLDNKKVSKHLDEVCAYLADKSTDYRKKLLDIHYQFNRMEDPNYSYLNDTLSKQVSSIFGFLKRHDDFTGSDYANVYKELEVYAYRVPEEFNLYKRALNKVKDLDNNYIFYTILNDLRINGKGGIEALVYMLCLGDLDPDDLSDLVIGCKELVTSHGKKDSNRYKILVGLLKVFATDMLEADFLRGGRIPNLLAGNEYRKLIKENLSRNLGKSLKSILKMPNEA